MSNMCDDSLLFDYGIYLWKKGDFINADKFLKRRLRFIDSNDEHGLCCLLIGKLSIAKNGKDIKYLQYGKKFNRCEIWYELLRYYRISEEWEKYNDLYLEVKQQGFKFDKDCKMFDRYVYDYSLPYELMLAAVRNNDYIAASFLKDKLDSTTDLPNIYKNYKSVDIPKTFDQIAVYVGNRWLGRNSSLWKLVAKLSKYFYCVIIGSRVVEPTDLKFEKITVIDPGTFFENSESEAEDFVITSIKKSKYLILYDNLDILDILDGLDSIENVYCWLTDKYFRIVYGSCKSVTVCLKNPDISNTINRILVDSCDNLNYFSQYMSKENLYYFDAEDPFELCCFLDTHKSFPLQFDEIPNKIYLEHPLINSDKTLVCNYVKRLEKLEKLPHLQQTVLGDICKLCYQCEEQDKLKYYLDKFIGSITDTQYSKSLATKILGEIGRLDMLNILEESIDLTSSSTSIQCFVIADSDMDHINNATDCLKKCGLSLNDITVVNTYLPISDLEGYSVIKGGLNHEKVWENILNSVVNSESEYIFVTDVTDVTDITSAEFDPFDLCGIVENMCGNTDCVLLSFSKLDGKCVKKRSGNIKYNDYLFVDNNITNIGPIVFKKDVIKEVANRYTLDTTIQQLKWYGSVWSLDNSLNFKSTHKDNVDDLVIYIVSGNKRILNEQLTSLGINFEEKSVNPVGKIEKNMLKRLEGNSFNYSKKVLSYILTHTEAWSDTYSNTHSNTHYVILNDNIKVVDDFEDRLINILTDQNQDAVAFYLNGKIGGYYVSKVGIDKLVNMLKTHSILDTVDNMFDRCNNLKLGKEELIKEIQPLTNFKHLEGYRFISGFDSSGYDIQHYQRPLEELKRLADNNPQCLGFNSSGWLKFKIMDMQDMNSFGNNENSGIYVKDIPKIINQRIKVLNNSKSSKNYSLTFTVTTCKRIDQFKSTMDNLILMCKDLDIVDEWVCIDDNSSIEDREEMRRCFPFFRFILKDPENRGHARSLNMLLDSIKTKYVFHFEDDWICNEPFSIKDYMDFIISKDIHQVVLRKNSWRNHDPFGVIDGRKVYKYIYNTNHFQKPDLNITYDKQFKFKSEPDTTIDTEDYWWWPGFSLNPSVYNIEILQNKVGKFNEKVKTELFEYDYALRCHDQGLVVCYVDMDIQHTGTVSSYVLNNDRRYYD